MNAIGSHIRHNAASMSVVARQTQTSPDYGDKGSLDRGIPRMINCLVGYGGSFLTAERFTCRGVAEGPLVDMVLYLLSLIVLDVKSSAPASREYVLALIKIQANRLFHPATSKGTQNKARWLVP